MIGGTPRAHHYSLGLPRDLLPLRNTLKLGHMVLLGLPPKITTSPPHSPLAASLSGAHIWIANQDHLHLQWSS